MLYAYIIWQVFFFFFQLDFYTCRFPKNRSNLLSPILGSIYQGVQNWSTLLLEGLGSAQKSFFPWNMKWLSKTTANLVSQKSFSIRFWVEMLFSKWSFSFHWWWYIRKNNPLFCLIFKNHGLGLQSTYLVLC